jgi:outer membrane immunogenic protein
LAALGMAPALAADLPAQPYKTPSAWIPAAYDWSGFYLGLNGGGASSRECWTVTAIAAAPVAPTSEGCHTSTGGLVGGQLGYRWQASGWVFGFEFQGDWTTLKGSNVSLAAPLSTNLSRLDGIGLITGQVGYAFNNILLYVKGGGAVTDTRYSIFSTAGGAVLDQTRDTRWGGSAGVGLEFSFLPDWSVAVEYDHLFMGSPNIVFTPTAVGVGRSDNISQGTDMATIRLNYRYGGPVIAKY